MKSCQIKDEPSCYATSTLLYLLRNSKIWMDDESSLKDYVLSMIKCAKMRHGRRKWDLTLVHQQVFMLMVLETGVAICTPETKIFSFMLDLLGASIVETNLVRASLTAQELDVLMKANNTYVSNKCKLS